MKKLLLTAVAAVTLVGPLAASAAAQSPRYGQQQQAPQAQPYQQAPPAQARDDRRNDNVGDNRRDRRQEWREDRKDARWDESRHNGYYRNNRWYAGPPPASRYGDGYNRGNITLGYRPWQRGQRLGYYNTRYAEVDYRSNNNLRRPPRGYHWVRDDGGDYLLAAIAGGLIAQVIINSGR